MKTPTLTKTTLTSLSLILMASSIQAHAEAEGHKGAPVATPTEHQKPVTDVEGCVFERMKIRDDLFKKLQLKDLVKYAVNLDDRIGKYSLTDMNMTVDEANYLKYHHIIGHDESVIEIKTAKEDAKKLFHKIAYYILSKSFPDPGTTDEILGIPFGPISAKTESKPTYQPYNRMIHSYHNVEGLRRQYTSTENQSRDTILFTFPLRAITRNFLPGNPLHKEFNTNLLIAWIEKNDDHEWTISISTDDSDKNTESGRISLADFVERLVSENCKTDVNKPTRDFIRALNTPFETASESMQRINEYEAKLENIPEYERPGARDWTDGPGSILERRKAVAWEVRQTYAPFAKDD